MRARAPSTVRVSDRDAGGSRDGHGRQDPSTHGVPAGVPISPMGDNHAIYADVRDREFEFHFLAINPFAILRTDAENLTK